MSAPVEPSRGTDPPAATGSTPAAPRRPSLDPEPRGAPIDRAAALAAGPPGVPRTFVTWLVMGAAVLSLGGLAGEHLLSSAGLNPAPTSVHRATPVTATPSVPPAPPSPSTTSRAQPVSASLGALMGLTDLTPKPAPPFSLFDQDGQTTSVPSLPPSVVVLTFFDGQCNDICPVLAAEIEQADKDLGARAARAQFLTVNTDPLALAASGQSAAVSGTGLGDLPNWRMLTGPLATLDAVWKAYGVSISVAQKGGLEAHNDVMYFVDPRGDLRFRATPFADEAGTGTYSLPPATITRWAAGIAAYVGALITR